MNYTRPVHLMVCFLLIIGLLAGCRAAHEDKQTIRFCLANNMVSALIVIAQEKGFFAEENILLETQTVTNSKMSNDLMLADKADMTTGAEGPISWVAFSPNSLRILTQSHRVSDTGVFARKDHGIGTETDLKGKSLAYLPGTVSFLYLAELMEKYHWSLDDFKLTALQPPAMPQALIGGNIDAFVMWEPWGYNAVKQLKDQALILRDPQLYSYESILVARADFIEKNPEQVKGVLRAMIKAENFIKSHKEESIALLAKSYKLEEAYLRDNWDLYAFHVQLTGELTRKLNRNGEMIIKYMPEFREKEMPAYRSLIREEYLKQVDPSRVSIP